MTNEEPRYAIVVAGGSGSRMQREVPKQFIPIGGQPLLMYTLGQFLDFDPGIQIRLVLPADQLDTWAGLCQQYDCTYQHEVVVGGHSRFASVHNGLATIAGEGLVAVHDGVRPFVSRAIIGEAFREAGLHGNAVVAVPLKDSIRRLGAGPSQAEDRTRFRLVQTPQVFRLDLLRQAYTQPEDTAFTDDASVVERLGVPIRLVAGSYENIKITTPEDLIWAEAFLQARKGN